MGGHTRGVGDAVTGVGVIPVTTSAKLQPETSVPRNASTAKIMAVSFDISLGCINQTPLLLQELPYIQTKEAMTTPSSGVSWPPGIFHPRQSRGSINFYLEKPGGI
jgi:hypothetical protein